MTQPPTKESAGDATSQVALLFTAVGVSIALVALAMDGISLKVLADAWSNSAPASAASRLDAFITVKHVNTALWNMGVLVFFGLAILTHGLALRSSGRFPIWVGWGAMVAGALSIAAAAIQLPAGGESRLGEMLFTGAAACLSLWALAVGLLWWRVRAPVAGGGQDRAEPVESLVSPRALIGAFRLLLAAATVVAIVATAADVLSRGPINVFNFFGYFTIQSNILLTVTMTLAGLHGLRAVDQPRWLEFARGLTTTNIVIVGIVYATLLAPLGAAGGVPVPWANTILHVVTPVLAALGWLLIGDRKRLPLSRLWLVLIYPATWLTVVLIRGATDGWVPYPFLDPDLGYGRIALTVVVIALGVAIFG